LLGFALELGGIIAGADDHTTQQLYEAGVNMGLGFQLKDDLLDVYGDPEKFGKQVGGDIISNKKTFLLIEALERAQGDDKAELNRWLTVTDFDKDQKVAAVTALFTKLEIDKLTETKINQYFATGFETIKQLPIAQTRKQPLIDFIEFLMARES
jgi:geranylgeranyl diphosphate synthase type II